MGDTSRVSTILVAEDDLSVRSFVVDILERAGFIVITAADGAEAELLSHSHHFDLLLTDIIMPKLDGYSLAERLRSSRSGLPVIFISGFVEGAIVAERTPSARILQKPLISSELVRTIQGLLD